MLGVVGRSINRFNIQENGHFCQYRLHPGREAVSAKLDQSSRFLTGAAIDRYKRALKKATSKSKNVTFLIVGISDHGACQAGTWKLTREPESCNVQRNI